MMDHDLTKAVWLALFGLLLALGLATTASSNERDQFSQSEVAADFAAMLDFVENTHPNLQHSADPTILQGAAESIRKSFHDGMSATEVWKSFALLNPYFGDAHVGVRRPVARLAAYEAAGGRLFPIAVTIDEAGLVRVAENRFEAAGVIPGARVLAVNGISASDIVATLQPRMRGRSENLQRLVMSLYFPQYFWTVYGPADNYVVRVKSGQTERDIELPETPEQANNGAISEHAYQLLQPATAYLDVPSFDLDLKAEFGAFLADAFARIRQDQATTLVIDLRRNTGGAHDLSDLLMSYITDQPYSAFSQITARVTEENAAHIPGATLGSVVSVPYSELQHPPAHLPNRFEGDVYVLVGGLTYSQAIVFATTVQDHGIAKIVGQETEGAANQSGQVKSFTAPNTGLQILAPLYTFTRHSGDKSARGIIPDLYLEDNLQDPMTTVNLLLRHINNDKNQKNSAHP